MQVYRNRSGESGVVAYELRHDGIVVVFRNGMTYLYDYRSTGRAHVDRMKRLAASGRGLSTYISRRVGARYAARLN
jgi:hypothetical protein